MKHSILFVDDEPGILNSLKRLFGETDYDVNLAGSGEEALTILRRNPVDLVVSDMQMPIMTGHELLRQIKQAYPKTMRVILSGYTEEREVYKSLLDGSAKLYLLKPWDGDALIKLVDRIFALQQLLREKNLLDAINKIEHLPSMNNSFHRICQLIEKDASLDDIATALEADQAISSSLLRLANAVHHGRQHGSVRKALAYVGLANLKNLVLVTALSDAVTKSMLPGFKQLAWQHSVRVNKLSHIYYETATSRKIPELYNMVGLLCDVGKTVLMSNFGEAYDKIMKSGVSGAAFFEAEKAAFGVTHQELGAYLFDWWGMPYSFVETALYHHSPLDKNVINREIVSAVHLADYFAWSTDADRFRYATLDEHVLEELKLTANICLKLAGTLKN